MVRWVLALLALVACSDDAPGVAPDAAPPPPADAAPVVPDAACAEAWADASPPASPDCPVTPGVADRLDEALAIARLDRCAVGYTEQDLGVIPAAIRADGERLPFYDAIWMTSLRAVPWARGLAAELDAALAAADPVAPAIVAAAARLGYAPAACAPAAPAAGSAAPLADAVAALIEARGGQPDRAALEADAADVPMELQLALAHVLAGVQAAAAARDAAVAGVDDLYRAVAFYGTPGFVLPYGPPTLDDAYLDVLRGVSFDYAAMYGGAAALALAVDEANLSAFAGAAGFAFRAATPLGDVVVNDAAMHGYLPAEYDQPIALLVDTGGDDLYDVPVGTTADEDHGVALAIDLGGADQYGYVPDPVPADAGRLPSDGAGRAAAMPGACWGPFTRSTVMRQGSAVLGIAFLYDLGGDSDQFASLALSQGFGVLGVGVLWDDGGDDRYLMEVGGQGAGVFGIGLLLDGGGADERRTYSMGQGFGYVRGVGVLADAGAEADVYFAEPDDALYCTPQLPGTANSSFTQGAGFGRRDDDGGKYMSGGLGILRDLGGADAYTTSVFGQGTGYWFGTGILADAGGNDRYDGKWYVQGSAAHFAIALFLEAGGDDLYNPALTPAATSIGVGHDFSLGVHLDEGGGDVYRAPGLSLGAGNTNGVGILVNLGGDDEYHAAGEPTLPAGNLSGEIPAGSSRELRPTVGLFIDVGGADVYDVPGSTVVRGDDSSWVNDRRVPPLATEHSAGLDVADGDVQLP